MRYLAALALLASVLIGVMACSGSSGRSSSPDIHLFLKPQVASIQEVNVDDVIAALQKRLKAYGLKGKIRNDGAMFVADLPADVDQATLVTALTTVGLLEFCEPLTDSAGNVAIVQQGGVVQYQPGTCEPQRDASGNVVLDGGSIIYLPLATTLDRSVIVWQPAKGELNGIETALTSAFMTNAFVQEHPITKQPLLLFEWGEDGRKLSGEITGRLAAVQFPLAMFFDGAPLQGEDGKIIAPTVQSIITANGQINSLTKMETEKLAKLLAAGPLPVPLAVVPGAK